MKKNHKYAIIIGIITYALILLFVLLNFDAVWDVVVNIFSVLTPVIYGFIIAYILSFPYNFLYNRCFSKMGTKRKLFSRFRKPLAMLLSYVLCFGVLIFLIVILVPQLSDSIATLIDNVPSYAQNVMKSVDSVIAFVKDRFGYNLADAVTYNQLMKWLTGSNVTGFVKDAASYVFPAALSTAKVFTTGLYNWIIGLFISIYLLSGKEKLCRQMRYLVVAYLPLKYSKKVLYITDLCNKKCGKFIIGKIIDSLIIGVICFIGLSIFKFDYALLISVIVGVANVIPFFGPIIGAVPSAFLLLIIDPIECLWFIVFVLVLQQFDGNILGPKILGESVGISGFWILFSVLVGSGLFGLPGMLLGVPVFAVIYTLVDSSVTRRLKLKHFKLRLAKQNKEEVSIPDPVEEVLIPSTEKQDDDTNV